MPSHDPLFISTSTRFEVIVSFMLQCVFKVYTAKVQPARRKEGYRYVIFRLIYLQDGLFVHADRNSGACFALFKTEYYKNYGLFMDFTGEKAEL